MGTRMFVVCGVALMIGGRVPLAAPGQEYTGRPGDPTQAKVWIQNTPLSVEVRGTPTVTLNASTMIQAKLVRQVWEYRTITVGSGQDTEGTLSTAGMEGWETTGLQMPVANGISLVFKRPR